jgi:ribonucleotide reductase beta subunit family protein with ferritin-like domain
MDDEKERILSPNPNRYALFPIELPEAMAWTKQLQDIMWTVDEVSLDRDASDLAAKKISERERKFLLLVFAYFFFADAIVGENLVRFYMMVQWAEIRAFYATQIYQEYIHEHMYAKLAQLIAKDPEQMKEIFDVVKSTKSIKMKTDYAQKWMNTKKSFAHRLAAFIFVEAIHFCTSFVGINYICKDGLLPGLKKSNEYIRRDETLHWQFGCYVYSLLEKTRLSEKEIHEMVDEAVEIEKQFVSEALSGGLVGLTTGQMKKYVEYMADRVLVKMGYKKRYNTSNPLVSAQELCSERKTQFYENHVTEYQKPDKSQEITIDLNSDF